MMDVNAVVKLARAAMSSQDWPEALRLWNVAQDLDPNIDPKYDLRGVAQLHIEEGIALGNGIPVTIERVENPAAHALLLQFESVGENCEFGLVQRRFGAEPLGLLRWTYTSPGTLIRLLESKFEGFGAVDTLEMSRAAWGEYLLKDLAYGAYIHTYINDCGADEVLFLKRQSIRLVWLKDKILSDLAEASKTFVYKIHHGTTDAAMARILSLMRGYGDNKLLCVRAAPPGAAAGSIAATEGGVITGYIGSVQPTAGHSWNICYEDWLSICQQVSTMSPQRPHSAR
jgi:hypothetical protein